jgi:hypothetical protein
MRILQQRLVIDVLYAGPLGNGREADRTAGARQASPPISYQTLKIQLQKQTTLPEAK